MNWIFLALAVFFEVAGTTFMKLSEGFSKPIFAALMMVSYVACFSLVTLAIRTIPLSIAYTIWAGVGTALVAMLGIFYFKEVLGAIQIAGVVLILVGVVLLNLNGAG